jgi:HSP20 family protein
LSSFSLKQYKTKLPYIVSITLTYLIMNRVVSLTRSLPVVLRRGQPHMLRATSSDAHNLPPALSRRRHDMLSPFSLNQMMREMDSLMPSFFGQDSTGLASKLAVDIEEGPNAFVIKADVPGMKAENINMHLSPDNVLSIEAERSEETKEGSPDSGTFYRIERTKGSMVRSFKIPDHVDVDGIMASVKDGVLSVKLPKVEMTPEHEKVKTIPVDDAE